MIILISLFSFIAYVNAACDGTTAAQCNAIREENCFWGLDANDLTKSTCGTCNVRCPNGYPDLAAYSASHGNCVAVRDSCCTATCLTGVQCPMFKCVSSAANCRVIPARPLTSGCLGCPTAQCPLDCTHIACTAVVLTCLNKIRADGFNSCCDKCGGLFGGAFNPCPVGDCPAPRSQLCKPKALTVSTAGCIGCPDFDCPPCLSLPCPTSPPASMNCTEVPGMLDINGCASCSTWNCPSPCRNANCIAVNCESQNKMMKKADGMTQCCDTCVDKPACPSLSCEPAPTNAQCKSIAGKTDANGCLTTCPTFDCSSSSSTSSMTKPSATTATTSCVGSVCSASGIACEALGKVLMKADPTAGICCDKCVDEPMCECRSAAQIMCEAAGNEWIVTSTTSPMSMQRRKRLDCKCPPALSGVCKTTSTIITATPTATTVSSKGCAAVCASALVARSNCREPLAIADAKGVCPTSCVCTETVKFRLTPSKTMSIDDITTTIKQATGVVDVSVQSTGNSFEVTLKGDTDVADEKVDAQKSFADATLSKLRAVDSLGQISVVGNVELTADTGFVSVASSHSSVSFIVALFVVAMV